MKTYEAVFILNERQVTDEGESLAQDIVDHLAGLGAQIIKNNHMGRRQFARPIKKQNSGIYLNFIFKIESDKVEQIKQRYRLNPAVFRSAVLLYEGPSVE